MLLQIKDEEKEPPHQVIFKSGENTVAVMITEYWTDIGGMQPYHDSYTFSLYTKDDYSDEMLVIADKICKSHNTFVQDYYQTHQSPLKPGLVKKLLRRL